MTIPAPRAASYAVGRVTLSGRTLVQMTGDRRQERTPTDDAEVLAAYRSPAPSAALTGADVLAALSVTRAGVGRPPAGAVGCGG